MSHFTDENGVPKPLRLLTESRIKWFLAMFNGQQPQTDLFLGELEKRNAQNRTGSDDQGEITHGI